MARSKRPRRALTRATVFALAALAALLALDLVVIRPWQLRWGATDQEVARRMPGDDLVADPSFNATRAVTVRAAPGDIWPWIVQMGYRRAGYYSYDWLDNAGRPSATDVMPELQHPKVGDVIPITADPAVGYVVRELQPNRSLVWFGTRAPVSWSWLLDPQPDGTTRLVTRIRFRHPWTSPLIAVTLLADAGDIVMMRKCLLGIKARAEALVTSRQARRAVAATPSGETEAARIPDAVEAYALALAATGRGPAAAPAPTIEDALNLGRKAAAALTGPDNVLERLSETDYAQAVSMMRGFVVNRAEAVFVQPDPVFFAALAKARGDLTSADFFDTYARLVSGGVWKSYIEPQTDEGGCVKFGSLALVDAYRRWTGYARAHPTRYRDMVAESLADIEEALTEDSCACGGPDDVARELEAFVQAFPDSSVAPRVRERIEQVRRGDSRIRFKCVAG